MSLNAKTILITGANGGLGRAIAKLAAQRGAVLALAEIDAENAAAARAALPADAKATAYHSDLTNAAEVEQMMAQIITDFGALDGVVNNAATLASDDTNAIDTPLESWQHTLDVNLTGAFLIYKYALPAMLKQGCGSLVTMSSVVAHNASAIPQIAYTTSKGALEAMTREIAMTYARDNIRANCIAPGPVWTDRTAHYFDTDEKWQSRRQHIPMGRLGRPEEIAALACFLLSDEAGWQTGGVYRADGGISASYVVDDRHGSQTP
ncbi:SDR family oxidoreductase [Alphaproteobacteria bacterium]|nr:SDR family oxidoreductase [Alphaproteobacteria bacterium]MDC0147622.1 SDR family oxidoreductase [Alphaproteobacteria bacterium]